MILADPETRSEWLAVRKNGIGGSDAACVIGKNKYKTNLQLWKEKCGLLVPPDISDKPAVAYGKAAEEHIRALFALDYPEYDIDYHEYRLYADDTAPYIYATLDGELTEKATGKQGILEIKTTTIRNSRQWDEWDGCVPTNYYVQILHQLLATGWDFVILRAYIRYTKDGKLAAQVKDYRIDRLEEAESLEILKKAEAEFWKSVIDRKEPALILPEI